MVLEIDWSIFALIVFAFLVFAVVIAFLVWLVLHMVLDYFVPFLRCKRGARYV